MNLKQTCFVTGLAFTVFFSASSHASVITAVQNSNYDIFGSDHIDIITGAGHVYLNDDATAIMAGGSVNTLHARDNAFLEINGGDITGGVFGYGNASINVNNVTEGTTSTGSVDPFGYNMYGSSTLNVNGGVLDWAWLNNFSVTNVMNFDTPADGDTRLVLSDSAILNVFGMDLIYENSHVSGYWETGESFSMNVVVEIDSINFTPASTNQLILHSSPRAAPTAIPVPATILLFMFGLIALHFVRGKAVRLEQTQINA